MDALHDGLETNPFDGKQYGCTLTYKSSLRGQGDDTSIYLPSLGYADDTTINTNSLENLSIQHKWVKYFLSFNKMHLNPSKCELIGRRSDGSEVTIEDIQLHHDLSVDGKDIIPLQHNKSLRYLGLNIRFDGCWEDQFTKSYQVINLFTRIIQKFSLPLNQIAYIYNIFLLPKLELAFHYVHGEGTEEWLNKCDSLMIGAIKHNIKTPIQLSHTVIALSLGLRLPSWMEIAIKVSELFLRINSKDDIRWSHLGRISLWNNCKQSKIDSDYVTNRWGGLKIIQSTQIKRSLYLAVHQLKWKLHHFERKCRAKDRHQHLFDTKPIASYHIPSSDDCSSSLNLILSNINHLQTSVAHDIWSGWGESYTNHHVRMYTDGSYHALTKTSAWSIVVQNQWLEDSSSDVVPSDENLIHERHIRHAITMGSNITCTEGIYPAELQAIARAIAMFPLTHHLHIFSDSMASIKAIQSYENQNNERKRLRMSARPLHQLIHHLKNQRSTAGGSLKLDHVSAHTRNNNLESIGNRIADYQANLSRSKPDDSKPLGLLQLPIQDCEYHLNMIRKSNHESDVDMSIIDDIRRVALKQILEQSMNKWKKEVR